jgi:hypothetical protein
MADGIRKKRAQEAEKGASDYPRDEGKIKGLIPLRGI